MNHARMLTFAILLATFSTLAGCGGGGGSSSDPLEGHYTGTFTAEGVGAGTADFTISSGNRVSGTTVNSSAAGRTGVFAGRIFDNKISGSIHEESQSEMGFSGTVQRAGRQLTLNLTFNGLTQTATYNLTKS